MDSASSSEMMMTETDDQDEDDCTPYRKRRKLFCQSGQDGESQSGPVNNTTNYNNEGDADEFQAMRMALGNSLILDNMFKYLAFEDTRNAVLVSQSWCGNFGYLLDKWTVFRIHFDTTSRLKIKVEERKAGLYYKIYHFGSIEDLETKLNSVPNKTIKVTESAHTIQDVAFKELLTRLSPWISYATFDCKQGSDTMQLTCCLKNLECLHIGSMAETIYESKNPSRNSFHHNNDPTFPAENFPKLKTVHLLHSCYIGQSSMIENLLAAAPNLKKIYDYPLSCARVLQTVGQQGRVKIASFNYRKDLLTLENGIIDLGLLWSLCGPRSLQLERLKIDLTAAYSSWNYEEACDTFSSLLSANSCSLETLQLYPLMEGHSLKFPVLPKLSSLHFYFPFSLRTCTDPIKIFSTDLNLNLIFPNVTNVLLHWDLKAGQLDHWFLGEQNCNVIFPQVRCLEIQLPFSYDDPWTTNEVVSIAFVFPHLDSLTVKLGGDIWLGLLSAIWKLWPQLHQLTIEVQVTEEAFSQRFFLDQIFTGIPEAKCKSLRASSSSNNNNNHNFSQEQIDNIQELRKRPAISTMTQLEDLKIIFHERIFTSSANLLPPFSPLAFHFGFNLLPPLQVTFAIGKCYLNKERVKKMLKPVIPLVDFIPDYWQCATLQCM